MSEAKSTDPLFKTDENGNKLKLTRKFDGINPPNTTHEKNALKAYIKGHSEFPSGVDDQGKKIYQKTPVKYEYVKCQK